jgi:hypothetical protein
MVTVVQVEEEASFNQHLALRHQKHSIYILVKLAQLVIFQPEEVVQIPVMVAVLVVVRMWKEVVHLL